jgi:hypothetical protein
MNRLERRWRWLLRAYPAWYRHRRGGEMLDTLLEASPPSRNWPSFRDARALVLRGLRVRGWVWLLSGLWASIGAAGAGYFFLASTQPQENARIIVPAWMPGPLADVYAITGVLAAALWLVLPVPVFLAGLVRLCGGGPRNWLRVPAWAGAWAVGFALMLQAYAWGQYPARYLTYTCSPPGDCVLNYGEPAIVSWGELAICAAWLALGVAMTWILARPARASTEILVH